jgi:hypothetical protein
VIGVASEKSALFTFTFVSDLSSAAICNALRGVARPQKAQ